MRVPAAKPGLCLLLMAALMSCKSLVLENRKGCPAQLYIDLEEDAKLESKASVRIAVRDSRTSEVMAADTPRLEDLDPDRYSLEIHKTEKIVVTGVTGIQRSKEEVSSRTLTIPSGQEGDPLYLFTSEVPAMEDELIVPARLRKDHSRMTFRFSLEDGAFPYHVSVIGNTSGLDLITGRPLEGPFRHEMEELSPGLFSCIVPRQRDLMLALELTPEEGFTADEDFSGILLLWEYLERLDGFSWALEDLPDINLDIDFFHLNITVAINDWNIAQTINLTI